MTDLRKGAIFRFGAAFGVFWAVATFTAGAAEPLVGVIVGLGLGAIGYFIDTRILR